MHDLAPPTVDADRLRRLLDVGRNLVGELEPDAVLERVLEVARDLTGARYAALGVLDERHRELDRLITSGTEPAARTATGELHELAAPVAILGERYGNLYLSAKDGGDFTQADEDAVLVLADWAGIAIDSARSRQGEQARRAALEQANRGLEATTAIARAIGGETDLGRVLELIVERARELVEARGVAILLLDGEDQLVVSATAGELSEAVMGNVVPVQGSVTGGVLSSGRSARLSNLAERLRFSLADHVDAHTGLFVPLMFRARPLGILAAFDREGGGEFASEDERLLVSFAASAATAVATAQSVAAEGVRRAIEISERERGRWARELHDETLQDLAGLRVILGVARRSDDVAAVKRSIEGAVDQIEMTITGLRHLITELRPAALDELGLGPALAALVDRTATTSGLDIALDAHLAYEEQRAATRHAAGLEETLYRVVQETLTNAAKHAGADHVRIEIVESGDEVRVRIVDDGCGFDRAAGARGFGLVGMAERVASVGGRLEIDSSPGGGTTVRATLPVRRAVATASAAQT